ncbi:DUF4160 domain-containing protein [Cyclobacterium salsum]|nr:DUF4160 domain-containing protein [Cyclobacterium salsum]
MVCHSGPTPSNDHSPPHFHVVYQDNEALIDIKTLEILEGHLPKRAKT